MVDHDFDVECLDGSDTIHGSGRYWQQLFNLLTTDHVMLNQKASSVSLNSSKQHWAGTKLSVTSLTDADVAALKGSHVQYFLPYTSLEEGSNQWMRLFAIFCIMDACFKHSTLLALLIVGKNPLHRSCMYVERIGTKVQEPSEQIWLHLDLIRPLIDSVCETLLAVEYGYRTIPIYPSGQIGFIIECKKANETKVFNISTELHEASFVLRVFAKRTILGEKY